MSGQATTALVKPIVERAQAIARLQGYLACIGAAESKETIMAMWADGSLSDEEAKLLIGFNALGAV